MKALFVAGAGTDVGKTFVSAGLIRHVRAHGVAVAALKPVASGYTTAAGSDAGLLLAAMGQEASEANVAAICPFRFAAPLAPDMAARREGRLLHLAEIVAFCRAHLDAATAPLLIEGVGGLMSPIAEDATGLDLMRALRAPALLVAGSYLGAISHALTAAAVLETARVDLRAIVVNESPGDAVDLADTCAAMARFRPDIPILALRRNDDDKRGSDFAEISRACSFTP